ncbi:MAG: NADH-quinone oxidoreductase subunit NuoN [Alphaproteobacteria bacterium]|nr:NADH-quinone oxidoreductase subunit NuoN [Alphaproteobacteria bacterium]
MTDIYTVITDFNLVPLIPEIFMALFAMGLLIVGVSQGNRSTSVICWASVAGLAITALLIMGLDWQHKIILNGMFVFDEFAGFMKLLVLLGLMASLALSVRYLAQEGIERFEYPVLVVMSGVGMMMMLSANNMLTLYVGLELQSLALYVLAAFHRNAVRSAEAGLKYFVLGALSSGMLLFGISLLYGFTGSIDFGAIGASLLAADSISFGPIFALVFIVAGLAFKISAVPFHMWTPDVYQGAPESVTALFAIVPKVAAMGLLMRLLFEPFAAMADQWGQIIYFLSLASMLVGAFGGIAQLSIKRLIAYSSIGNMGYALIGIVAGTPQGAGAVIVYLLIYMIMTAGVFAVILSMRRNGAAVEWIGDLAGLSKSNPVMAYAMAILLFSMAGIPPMAGFFGKILVFQAAVAEGYYVLSVLGVVSSVVAAYYYLRVIKVMFFDEAADPFDGRTPFARRAVLLISTAFVLAFILKPSLIVESAQSAALSLFFG